MPLQRVKKSNIKLYLWLSNYLFYLDYKSKFSKLSKNTSKYSFEYCEHIAVTSLAKCSRRPLTRSEAALLLVSESEPSRSRRIYSMGSSSNNSTSESIIIDQNLSIPLKVIFETITREQIDFKASGLENISLCRAGFTTDVRKLIALLTSYKFRE